jgi:hypothetical protein
VLSTHATQVSVWRLQYRAVDEVHPLFSTQPTQVFVPRSQIGAAGDLHVVLSRQPMQVFVARSQIDAGSAQSPLFVQPTQVCDSGSQSGFAAVQFAFETHWTQTA